MKNNIFEVKKGRGVDLNNKVLLFSIAGGRCELCNELLIKDKITKKDVILGEMAHIYAFNKGGARAKGDKLYLNKVENLILVCGSCHDRIDKKQLLKYYTDEYLLRIKKEHEKRIRLLTGFKNDRRTKVLKIVANVNNEVVELSNDDIVEALMKEQLFSYEDNPTELNFTSTSGINNTVYWKSKMQEVDEIVKNFYYSLKRDSIKQVSIFGIGPIPLLIYLGSKLENKIKTKLFQRHRDGENWNWKGGNSEVKYKFNLVRKGLSDNKVAILLSLSGYIDQKLLPGIINKDYSIYELSLESNPNYNFLRTEKDLFNFEKEFSTAISKIKNNHAGLRYIDIFPAVPAPIAIACGRSLNKNSDPKLRIYNTSNRNKFRYSLKTN